MPRSEPFHNPEIISKSYNPLHAYWCCGYGTHCRHYWRWQMRLHHHWLKFIGKIPKDARL